MVNRDDLLEDETIIRDCVYRVVSNSKIKADIYPPSENTNIKLNGHPIFLFIHGGGFMNSNRKDICAPFIDKARQKGFVIVSMDYRLAPETKLDGMLEDLEAMGKWLLEELPSKLPDTAIDTSKIVVVGSSVGAVLALSTPKHWGGHQPCAIVSLYGPADLRKVPFLGLTRAARLRKFFDDNLEKKSPEEYMAPESKVFEDGTDFDNPPSDSDALDAKIKANRPKFSAWVVNQGGLAKIAVEGISGQPGRFDFQVPKKMAPEEDQKYLELSPIYLGKKYQFPPTYIVRCKDDDVFKPHHSEDLRKALIEAPCPVQDCPAIEELQGKHASDNVFTELEPAQERVLKWLSEKVGLQ
ncbi:hypothetical protein HYFRA_00001746 [Hymenoscyphus fraxineus]|uniref:Alpha/beta hydrolase fold-3 domain-containing protein n=1 Tax=Hymenoscyphus fraxineus TaxID=746836 RepID=A0A9N9L974_9HELO|nr:hypothetical protein HYFRA_00001746 [Hymenoscyphus fraxineus]